MGRIRDSSHLTNIAKEFYTFCFAQTSKSYVQIKFISMFFSLVQVLSHEFETIIFLLIYQIKV